MTRWGPRQQEADPYGLLGLDRGAAHADVIRAYHRQARFVHPDASPQDPDAAARFRTLTWAYEMLSDPARRAAYDQRHPGPAAARPRPPGRAAQGAARQPDAAHPARAGGAPIWAGPVYLQPPGQPVHMEPAWPDVRTLRIGPRGAATVLLSDLVSCYFGADEDWPLWT